MTCRPPVGAAALSVTVPVEDAPPTTEEGENASLEGAMGWTVSVADFVDEPKVAVIDSASVLETALVVTRKVAEAAFAATVTLAGRPIEESPPDRVTTVGDETAAESVTVPVEAAPPTTEDGENARELILSASSVSVADFAEDPSVAVIDSVSVAATIDAVTVNVALVAPPFTVTEDG